MPVSMILCFDRNVLLFVVLIGKPTECQIRVSQGDGTQEVTSNRGQIDINASNRISNILRLFHRSGFL